ncbi:POK19 protein, partial [Ramphastos sulfuratus]|nr:POK19 protein [Ramphastos sulfuratus]
KDAKKHLLKAFAALGVPQTVKTDNGPAYSSQLLRTFFSEWGIRHITGIPHSPTGQSIFKRSHQT